MNFNVYQQEALKTDLLPDDKIKRLAIIALGLVGESGECADKIKKIIHRPDINLSETDLDNLKKEMGDVLWYLALLANEYNFELDDVAKTNIIKLQSRLDRGTLHGKGDDR